MTTEQIDLDEALGELRTLLHEYGDLAKELLNHPMRAMESEAKARIPRQARIFC